MNILGIYLINWNAAATCTTPFSEFYTNMISGTSAGAISPGLVTGTFWGGAPSGSPATNSSSSGSLISQVTTTGNYYNLLLSYQGGGTVGAVYGFYCITRLG
jgi:hypothetical protein